uniref:Uncharacterized protein n=1 Tax=Coccidioides posadasii RMSCC 3488 TaxID=454284 RepID=A0A0J6FTX0_COCPO|nr:hypothetical protein CPAG_09122 [Coccidioides posadasii RMSCC 3488]
MVHHSQTLRTRYWYYEILILKPLAKSQGIKYTASQKLGKLHSKDSGQIEEVDGNLYSRFPGESAKLGLLQHATPDRPVLLTNQDSNIIPGIFFIRYSQIFAALSVWRFTSTLKALVLASSLHES